MHSEAMVADLCCASVLCLCALCGCARGGLASMGLPITWYLLATAKLARKLYWVDTLVPFPVRTLARGVGEGTRLCPGDLGP